MRVENYSERRIEIGGWPVNITYRMDGKWHAKACEEAEKHVTDRAAELLPRIKRREV
jgi:hypothetical protein